MNGQPDKSERSTGSTGSSQTGVSRPVTSADVGDEARPQLLILVMRMEMAPFDRIFREGAAQTWLTQEVAGVRVWQYEGLPIPPWRRFVSAVRERLRLRGPWLLDVNLVGKSTAHVRLVNAVFAYAYGGAGAPRSAVRHMLRLLQASIRGLEMVAVLVRRHRLASVQVRAGVLVSEVVQTTGKMLDVQLPVFAKALDESEAQGFLVATMSTYVDFERILAWHCEAQRLGIDFASMPATSHAGRLFQGGCMYFSRAGLRSLVEERGNIRGGMINDIAITDWLCRTGRNWHDLPVVTLTQFAGLPEACPMCVDPTLVAVRCTKHDNRDVEIARLWQCHHHHVVADDAQP